MKQAERWFLGGKVLVLILALSGCDSIYGVLQKEGAQEKKLLGEIVPFEPNPQVKEVQQLLKLYGYKVGSADGVLGANTRNAIKVFQEENGLKPSRFIDYNTWDFLHVFEGYGLVVNGEVNYAAVQQAIKNAGFDPGKVDGKPGARTQASIKKFQSAQGLSPDGNVGFKTLWALADYLPFQKK